MAAGDESSKRILASVSHAPSNYALNGKVMLCSVIVLFVAVLIILCFHSYARWLFHRHNRRIRRRIRAHLRSISASREPGSGSSLVPLDRSVLDKIPVFVYSSASAAAVSPPLECAVCLSDFEDGEEGRILPKCEHAFHVECIDTWFRSRSNCPLCRAPVQTDKSSTRSEQAPAASTATATETAVSVCGRDEGTETGGSSSSDSSSSSLSSSSLARFPPESSPRQPVELVGILVEIPRGSDDPNQSLPGENGSKFPDNRVLSLKKIWSF